MMYGFYGFDIVKALRVHENTATNEQVKDRKTASLTVAPFRIRSSFMMKLYVCRSRLASLY